MIWLRSAVFNLWFLAVTFLLCLPTPLLRLWARRHGRRGVILAYARFWARAVLAGLQTIVGIDWKVTGLEHLPRGAALIASQHQSVFETLLWTVLLPDFAFVLKRELLRIPLFGAMLKAGGMIAVDRSHGAAALRGMLREGEQAIAEGRQLVIFPEGTRVTPGQSIPLQPGVAALAARTGLPVTPVVTDSGRLWGRGAFRKQPGTIAVDILPSLPAGLPREALLGHLASAFSAGPLQASVENTVDTPPSSLARQARRHLQDVDLKH